MKIIRHVLEVLVIFCIATQVLSLFVGVTVESDNVRNSYIFVADRLKFAGLCYTYSRPSDTAGTRVKLIDYGEGLPWWVTEDLAHGLGYINSEKMIEVAIPHWLLIILTVLGYVVSGGIREMVQSDGLHKEEDAAVVAED